MFENFLRQGESDLDFPFGLIHYSPPPVNAKDAAFAFVMCMERLRNEHDVPSDILSKIWGFVPTDRGVQCNFVQGRIELLQWMVDRVMAREHWLNWDDSCEMADEVIAQNEGGTTVPLPKKSGYAPRNASDVELDWCEQQVVSGLRLALARYTSALEALNGRVEVQGTSPASSSNEKPLAGPRRRVLF